MFPAVSGGHCRRRPCPWPPSRSALPASETRAVLSLGLAVRPRHWNDRTSTVRKTHSEADRLNEHLQHRLAKAQAEVTTLASERVTAARPCDRVCAVVRPDTLQAASEEAGTGLDAGFFAYARDVLQGYRTRGQINTFQAYRSGLRKLAAWHRRETGREQLTFREVTPRLVRRFHAHLAAPKEDGGCGNRPNTVLLFVSESVALLDAQGWQDKAAREGVFSILDGYDLSMPEARHRAVAAQNALANKCLLKVAMHAGLIDASGTPRKVGFHLSRHSIAGYLLEQGTDVHTIQRILGHSSVRVTEQYLRCFERSTADDAMRSVRL